MAFPARDRPIMATVDPFHAGHFYDQSQHHINQSGKGGAENQARIARFHGDCACESCKHGAQKGEAGSQENRALKLGEQLVDQRTDAGAEERGALAHAVADDGRNRDGGSQDGQHLLQRKKKGLPKRGSVLDTVHEIHEICLPFVFPVDIRGKKNSLPASGAASCDFCKHNRRSHLVGIPYRLKDPPRETIPCFSRSVKEENITFL